MKALFPGTFDPPSFGHLNIIERASSLFEQLDVVIANNQKKNPLLEIEERREILEKLTEKYSNVTVTLWDNLIVKYAKERGIQTIVRGVRGPTDFQYEFELALLNRSLASDIETIFLPTQSNFMLHRSSTIKELIQAGIDVSEMLPEVAAEAIRKKVNKKRG